jgi:hypothetical protein
MGRAYNNSLVAKYADDDDTLKYWDFLFVGYRTAAVKTYLDISRILRDRFLAARKGDYPFGHQYEKFALARRQLS